MLQSGLRLGLGLWLELGLGSGLRMMALEVDRGEMARLAHVSCFACGPN